MWWWPHHRTKKSACQRKDLLLTLYLNLRTIRTSNGKSNSFERCADSQWISEASSKEPKVHFRVFFSVLQILQNMTRAANCSRPGLKSTPRRLLRRGKWSSSRLCGMESHVLYFCIFVFCKFWKWSIFRLCRMESHVQYFYIFVNFENDWSSESAEWNPMFSDGADWEMSKYVAVAVAM